MTTLRFGITVGQGNTTWPYSSGAGASPGTQR